MQHTAYSHFGRTLLLRLTSNGDCVGTKLTTFIQSALDKNHKKTGVFP